MKCRSSQDIDIRGITLLEVVSVIVLIAILFVIFAGALTNFRGRAEGVKCMSNLKSLHVSLAAYIADRNTWPQCPIDLGDEGYDAWWLTEMKPYGIGKQSWQCPTIVAKKTVKEKDDEFKIHYIPTPFDEHRVTPFRWPTQPWLVEIGDSHGNGNLVILPDGSVRSFNELIPRQP